ncbi:MAG: hypothetical protein Q8747_02125 [Candidatus Phytoplasma australasiaticum]|uniref:Uncharacterized protein n=2 Tax=16SrII (Peanut WB group) TaxID=85621 RepID=A0A9K3WSE6_9MOLU|nr:MULTISPECIES: hypothetical protein [Phytoplasma]MDV3155282.1 hypothetical protein [Sweet potato little leaf phytoplasma]MCG3566884.1 hypothetical protein [Sesame phyllody phytoplasma]MDO8031287.1 hypothetical protein [Candidatus Phytoplasma australasiaticum]MDO8031751.1 hypothetical protein [Candidatus Phytoplasma australasiaticum]MDO8046775.1 hypothetical protein [Candidatus Phytoplasma australasiaticum]
MINLRKKHFLILSIILLAIIIIFIYIKKTKINNDYENDISFQEVSNSNLSEEINSKELASIQDFDVYPKDKNIYISENINNVNNNNIDFQEISNSNFANNMGFNLQLLDSNFIENIDLEMQSSIQGFNALAENNHKTNINIDQWKKIKNYFLEFYCDDVFEISFLPPKDQIFIQNEKTKFNLKEKIKQRQDSIYKWQKLFNESQIKINNLQKKINSLPNPQIIEDEFKQLTTSENNFKQRQLYKNNNIPNIHQQIQKYDIDKENEKLQSQITQIEEKKEYFYKEIKKEKENQKRFSKIIYEIKKNHYDEIRYNIQYIKNNFYIESV